MLCLVFLPAMACFAGSESGPQLTLVKDGQPASTIVIPKNADEWTNRSAEWLQSYVQQSTGAKLPILSDDKELAGTLISVGKTALAEKAAIDLSDLKWDGGKLIARGNVLFLIGRDSTRTIKSSPLHGARGTARAVLTFLEDACGIRWFLPTPEGELIPTKTDISVAADLSKTVIPAFAYADGRAAYSPGFLKTGGDTPASIINNFRNSISVLAGGCYYEAVPADKYFKEHPEYFALINGKRTGDINHLCSSNPEVRQLLLRWIQEKFDAGYDLVTLGQEDGYLRCECPECEKLDQFRWKPDGQRWDVFQKGGLKNTPCDRLFLTHKWVIDEVRKTHPNQKVLLLSYAPTAWPSKTIEYFGDNVVVEMANQEPEYVAAWKGKATGMTTYMCWFNIQCPMGMNIHSTPREVAGKLRYLHEQGFIGLYLQAETCWGLQGPMFYEFGKLMGNPALDHEALVKEYCHGVYGKAGETMLQFFARLYARLEEVLPEDIQEFSGRNLGMPVGMGTTELYLAQYSPAHLQALEGLLQQAEREADTERSRGWLRLTRDHFDFTKLLTEALISYRAFQADATPKNRLELKQRVEAFNAYRMKIISYPKSYTDHWFPGHAPFCNWLTADVQSELKIYYTPWDQRKPDVLKRGVEGLGLGYGGSSYHSFVREPFTLKLSEPVKTQP